MSAKSFPPPDKGYFFIIGGQRCGTTYLYELLRENADVAMAEPERPEPKWFLNPQKAQSGRDAWLKALFNGVSAQWYGEKGTSYLEYPATAASVLATFPEARFVVILREPIARAISNYRFSVDNRVETLPIEQALTPEAENRPYDRQKISTSPFTYLKRGRYADYLEAWTAEVPKDRIHIVLFEELIAGEKAFNDLCVFLGITPFVPPNMGHVVNAAIEPLPEISKELRSQLEAYYWEPNARLDRFLGRHAFGI